MTASTTLEGRRPAVTYRIAPRLRRISFQARLEAYHRLRHHLDEICHDLRGPGRRGDVYTRILQAVNDVEDRLDHLAAEAVEDGSSGDLEEAEARLEQSDAVRELVDILSAVLAGAGRHRTGRAERHQARLVSIGQALRADDEQLPLDRLVEELWQLSDALHAAGRQRSGRPPRAGRPGGPGAPPAVRLDDVGTLADAGIRDPYALRAITSWPVPAQPGTADADAAADAADAAAQVRLEVMLEDFGPESFIVLPYVLAHELMCHVLARSRWPEHTSSFAEGLMDWVALTHVLSWLKRDEHEWHRTLARHAVLLREAMVDRPGPHEDRARGLRAADHLVRWFPEADPTLAEADAADQVATLAVALNVADVRPEDLEYLVTRAAEEGAAPASFLAGMGMWSRGEASAEEVLAVMCGRGDQRPGGPPPGGPAGHLRPGPPRQARPGGGWAAPGAAW